MEFSEEESLMDVDDEFMVGGSILVKPVSTPGATSVSVTLPKGARWYDYHDKSRPDPQNGTLDYPVTIESIPIFVKAGSIIPQKDRLRRSSAMMAEDPLTLYVFMDEEREEANGWVYVDDGTSLHYQKGEFFEAKCCLKNGLFKWEVVSGKDVTTALRSLIKVDRIVIIGLAAAPKAVSVAMGSLQFTVEDDDEETAPVLQIQTLHLDFSQSLEIKLVPFPDDL